MCVYYTDVCLRGHSILVHATACRAAHRRGPHQRGEYCLHNEQTLHNRSQRGLMSTDSCPVCHDVRHPAATPGEDQNDGGGGNGGDDDDDDKDDKDDNGGKGRRENERTGAFKATSLPTMRGEKRKRFPKIIPPRKSATRIIRRRESDHQEEISKKALSGEVKGRQQYPLRPKILETDSRIKVEKVTRDRSSRDEYEEEEEF
ncbi:hypothetical protein BOTNAR_0479g00030 [Botryotinia narcissicola]|uniref:Uncharacterized protein n=1 Tax=Botryotinia narcissicola TaxID=278944 RepID=A0A4Z1HUD6_9HELO|nr:hypothetical protein BOTNAR_0479g00030 [Botryotinia narcissicola]